MTLALCGTIPRNPCRFTDLRLCRERCKTYHMAIKNLNSLFNIMYYINAARVNGIKEIYLLIYQEPLCWGWGWLRLYKYWCTPTLPRHSYLFNSYFEIFLKRFVLSSKTFPEFVTMSRLMYPSSYNKTRIYPYNKIMV